MRTGALLLVLLLAAGPAAAGEGTVEGSLTAGRRFLSGEDEGRFGQDLNLDDGFRLFDLGLEWFDPDERTVFDRAELDVTGLGEPNRDVLLALRGGTDLLVRGGYRRDDYSYRATGDPFPYEILRERGFVKTRLRVSPRLTVRAGWDRSSRRGEAVVSAFTEARERPPGGEIDDTVRDRRPLDRLYDTWMLGADAAVGCFRFGATQSVRVGVVEDERIHSLPEESTPVRRVLRRNVRSKSWRTVLKAGVTAPGGDLDVTAFATFGRTPLDGRISGSRRGFDNRFREGSPLGPFTAAISGENDLTRTSTALRLETLWRPAEDWEVVLDAERRERIDRASLRLVERRTFERADAGPERTVTREEARIRWREDRLALDLLFDVNDDLRLRAGEETYVESIETPTDTPGDSLEPTDHRSRAWRHTLGVDVDPADGLSLSLLGRVGTNDEPHTAVSADRSEEVSFRGRWRADDAWFLSLVYRRKAYHRDAERDSDTRTDSLTGTASWAAGPCSASCSVTRQEFRTRTATSFFDFDRSFTTRVEERVTFESSDWIVTLDGAWEAAADLRFATRLLWVRSEGDYEADSREVSLTGEYDLSETLTALATARAWRLDEAGRRVDDFSASALELALRIRF